MDAQKKAAFRAKLRESAQTRDKRIDSPLVRYNEYDQPVCRVCNVTLKSESLWTAHQASRKHREAIENLKSAAGTTHSKDTKLDPPTELHKRLSTALPADFFDKNESKRQKSGLDAGVNINSATPQSSVLSGNRDSLAHLDGKKEVSSSGTNHMGLSDSIKKINDAATLNVEKRGAESMPSSQLSQPSSKVDGSESKQVKGNLPEGFFDSNHENESEPSIFTNQQSKMLDGAEVKHGKGGPPEGFFDSGQLTEITFSTQFSGSTKKVDSEIKAVKGALPEGFFDNKDADLRARGIQPVKVDINDAYKEFEKEIQSDLQEVDDRLGEEEIDAAEVWEEFESLEHKQYSERVEMIKKQLMEVKSARLSRVQERPVFMREESSDESSSEREEEEEEEEDFAVDWRAKHL